MSQETSGGKNPSATEVWNTGFHLLSPPLPFIRRYLNAAADINPGAVCFMQPGYTHTHTHTHTHTPTHMHDPAAVLIHFCFFPLHDTVHAQTRAGRRSMRLGPFPLWSDQLCFFCKLVLCNSSVVHMPSPGPHQARAAHKHTVFLLGLSLDPALFMNPRPPQQCMTETKLGFFFPPEV